MFLLYLPFVWLGPGTDLDSGHVIRSARILIDEGRYEVSRQPGYFVHEAGVATLYFIGGVALSNLGSLVAALAVLEVVFKVRR